MADIVETSPVVESTDRKVSSSKDSSPEHQRSNDTANFSSAETQEPSSPSPGYVTPDDEETPPNPAELNHQAVTEQCPTTNERNESESETEQQKPVSKSSSVHSEVDTQNDIESTNNENKKESSESAKTSPGKQGNSDSVKPDIDKDAKNPAFVPRSGRFFEHDDRNADVETEEQVSAEPSSAQPEAKSSRDVTRQNSSGQTSSVSKPVDNTAPKRSRADANSRWSHDLFNPKQQAPKSTRELRVRYGQGSEPRRPTHATENEKKRTGESNEDEPRVSSSEKDATEERVRQPKRPERSERVRKNRSEKLNGERSVRRHADDDGDERLAYDDASQSDASEQQSDSESESDAKNGVEDSKSAKKPVRKEEQSQTQLQGNRIKRPPKAGEYEARSAGRHNEEVRVLRSRRAVNEDESDGRTRTARAKTHYGYSYPNYDYRYHDYDNYPYSYDYYFDEYAERNKPYTNGVRANRGRNDAPRTRQTNGARRDRAYFEEYNDEYSGASRAFNSQTRRNPEDCYYDDPGDSRSNAHNRLGRGAAPQRSAYSARSNRTGVDADRWLHDRADPQLSEPLKTTPASQGRAQREEATRPRNQTSAQTTANDKRNAQRGRSVNEANRNPPDSADKERNGDANKGSRRPNSGPNTLSRNSQPDTRSAKRTGQYQDVQSFANSSPATEELAATSVYDSQSTLAPAFYTVAPVAAAQTVTTGNSGVVTSEQLNVLFDAFSAATAQFAPDVSNQILQTVAHTLMMHGAPAPGAVDSANAADLALPVVAAPADSSMLSLVTVPVPVPVPLPVLPTGALLTPAYGAPAQSVPPYSLPAPFSAPSPQPALHSVPQQRRVRAPLPIVNPNDVASGKTRRDLSSKSHLAMANDVAVTSRAEER